MQPNIPMKFAVYVAWILLCKHCKFGEKIHYDSGDIEFFLGDYFFLARPVYTALFTTNGRKQNEKEKQNNMYRIEKKLDYDLTNIHSLANS